MGLWCHPCTGHAHFAAVAPAPRRFARPVVACPAPYAPARGPWPPPQLLRRPRARRGGPRVEPGTITGLIGPNGAGKTTLFNCVSGLIPPERGAVRVRRQRHHRLARRSRDAGRPRPHVPDRPRLSAPVRAGEPHALRRRAAGRAAVGARSRAPAAVARREAELRGRAFAVARRLNLDRVVDDPASDLSGGQKKLLELGRALMTDPKLMLLDEPIAGVNPDAGRRDRRASRSRCAPTASRS